MHEKTAPLSGVRVLDISNFFAAPLVSAHLADFGAEVIRIEPPGGDPYRRTRLWPVIARNKKSVTLDLSSEHGGDALRTLVGHADVIVENYAPRWLASRGLDWPTLHAVNPRLIMLSLSCFGQTGPYAGKPGNGTMSEAFSGFTHMTGPAEGAPVAPSTALGDAVGALSAAFGVMTALYWRDAKGGEGQRIDASIFEPMLQVMAQTLARWEPGKTPRRLGNRMPESFLRNVFETSDGGYLLFALSTPRQLREFLEMIGANPEDDPESAAAAWARTVTRDDAFERCLANGVLAAPVNDVDDILADPHIAARESVIRMSDSQWGDVLMPAPTPRLEKSPGSLNWTTPPLGAHNEEILCGLAGMDPAKVHSITRPDM